MRTVLPHIRRAIQVNRRLSMLERTRSALADGLERLRHGVVLVNRQGRVVFANQVARAITAQKDGLAITADGLVASAYADRLQLRRLLDDALRTAAGEGFGAGGALRVSRPSQRRPFVVLVAPLNLALAEETPSGLASVFISDPEARIDADGDFVRHAYGLTATEAQVASAFAATGGIDHAAEALRISRETARWHLRHIFRKTGTHRQAALLTLLLDGPPRPVREAFAPADVDRWPRPAAQLAATDLPPENAHHPDIARHAHEAQLRVMGDVAALTRVHDQLAVGALLVDRDMRVHWANAAARRLLAAPAGLRIVKDTLEASDSGESDALRQAIARAGTEASDARSSRGPFSLMTRPGSPPLPVVVLQASDTPPRFFEHAPPVLLLLFDRSIGTAPDTRLLRTLFGFTDREAELAALMMQGLDVDECARRLGVTVSTTRTFLARITAKTDSHTQATLVRQLLAVPRVASHA